MSSDRKDNLRFCKYILGLSKQAVDIAARAELAQYPVDVFIKVMKIHIPYVRIIHQNRFNKRFK
jgi:hypothetical protein